MGVPTAAATTAPAAAASATDPLDHLFNRRAAALARMQCDVRRSAFEWLERAEEWPPPPHTRTTTPPPPPLQTRPSRPAAPSADALLRVHAATNAPDEGSDSHLSALAPLPLPLQLQQRPLAAAAAASASALSPSAAQPQSQQRPLWRWLARHAEQHGIFGPPFGARPDTHPDAAQVSHDSSAAASAATAASSPAASLASEDSTFDLSMTTLNQLPWPPPSLGVRAHEQLQQHKRNLSSSSDSDDSDDDDDDEPPDRKRRRMSASPAGCWADATVTANGHTDAAAFATAKPSDAATQSTSASSTLSRFLPDQPTYGPEFVSAAGAAASPPGAALASTSAAGAPGASGSAPPLSTPTAAPRPLYFPSVFAAQLVAISLQYNDSPATASTHAFASVRGVPKEFLRRRPVATSSTAPGAPSVPAGSSSSAATAAAAPAAMTSSQRPSSAAETASATPSLSTQPPYALPHRLRLTPSMPGCEPVRPLPVRPSAMSAERAGGAGFASSLMQLQSSSTLGPTGSAGMAAVASVVQPVASRAAPSPPPPAGPLAPLRPARPSILDPVAGIPPRPLRIYIPAAHSLYNRPSMPLPALAPAAVSAAFATPVQLRT